MSRKQTIKCDCHTVEEQLPVALHEHSDGTPSGTCPGGKAGRTAFQEQLKPICWDVGAKLPKQMSLLQAHLKPGPAYSRQQAPGRRACFCFLSGMWTPVCGHICKGC